MNKTHYICRGCEKPLAIYGNKLCDECQSEFDAGFIENRMEL